MKYPPLETWERLSRAARESGWRNALSQGIPSGSELWRYATDPRESDALYLLPTVKTGRALFWGNALAVLPFLLAESFTWVVISDSVQDRLAFARHRQEQERVANVRCIETTDVEDVVRRDGRFHLIVVGEEFSKDGRSLPFWDSDLPTRLSRLLDPGGVLAYSVRFRRLQYSASLRGRSRDGSRLSTYRGHARLLHAAGFSQMVLYWRRPDSRPYQAYVPLDRRNVTAYYLRGAPAAPGAERARRLAVSLANIFGILPSLVQNLLIFARKA